MTRTEAQAIVMHEISPDTLDEIDERRAATGEARDQIAADLGLDDRIIEAIRKAYKTRRA